MQSAVSWQTRRPETTVQLGGLMGSYLRGRKRDFQRTVPIFEIWNQILPPLLSEQCKLKEYKSGVLVVEVPPGPVMQQMHLMRQELVKELKNHCPRCGLKQIKFVPVSAKQE